MNIPKHIQNLITKKHYIHYLRWRLAGKLNDAQFQYNLPEKAVVFDVGGYCGEWSEKLHKLFKPQIYIFEPVNDFAYRIRQKFEDQNAIEVFNFGLGARNETLQINLSEDASSVHTKATESETTDIQIRDCVEFMQEHDIKKIHLMKLNVEGAEYDILEHLIAHEKIGFIDDLQIQFHDFIDNAAGRRKNIRKLLSKTHQCVWSYPFVWERWKVLK